MQYNPPKSEDKDIEVSFLPMEDCGEYSLGEFLGTFFVKQTF